MDTVNMNRSKIFGGQYTFEEFTRLLKKDLKPKTMSLVKEIYFDTEDLLNKDLKDEANESWSRLLQLDVFDFESNGSDSLDESKGVSNKDQALDITEQPKIHTNKNTYKNNVMTFKKGTDRQSIKEALEWMKEVDKLMDQGDFEEAFDIWNIILDMDIIEFSYGGFTLMQSMEV